MGLLLSLTKEALAKDTAAAGLPTAPRGHGSGLPSFRARGRGASLNFGRVVR